MYKDLLDLLDKTLIPNCDNAEGKVFFHKMKGDYYRYLGEFLEGHERKDVIDSAQDAYNKATEEAE